MSEPFKNKIILAIETTQKGGSISLLRGNKEIGALIGNEEVSKSETFLGMLEEVLLRCSVKKGQIDFIAVSSGPGSQTGIRIGLSVVKGLSDSLGINYSEFSLLDALRQNRAGKSGMELTAVLLGRSRVCFRIFGAETGKKEFTEMFQVCELSDFRNILRAFAMDGGESVSISKGLADLIKKDKYLNGLQFRVVDNLAGIIGLSAVS